MIEVGDIVKVKSTNEEGLVTICYDECAVVILDEEGHTQLYVEYDNVEIVEKHDASK